MNIIKSLLFVVFAISINTIAVIAQDFITTWQTTTDNESITLPTDGIGYSYMVDWGDGSTDPTSYTGNATHVYATAGTYTVSISGDFPTIAFYLNSDYDKIMSIEQWGDQVWANLYYAFYECSNLVINATDAPDLSLVSDLSGMFHRATSVNQDISHWDVSNITRMREMFMMATAFDQDLSDWNVSSVSDMSSMFNGASSFNQDLSSWDVGSVTSMLAMFLEATSFNQDISPWNISNVTVMSGMLNGSNLSMTNYDLLLEGWAPLDVQSGVTLGAEGLKYCSGDAARATLKSKGWSFDGDDMECQQYITFDPLDPKTFGDTPFELTATISSGLDISYSSFDETVATIEGSTVTILGAGSTTITASQAGDDNYKAATSVDQVLTVNKADQTITFDPMATKTLGDAPFGLTATASSGLTVEYTSSDETIATNDGSTVTILGVGTTIITATQEGNEDFNSAPPVEQSLQVIASSVAYSVAGTNISIYPNPASNHIAFQYEGIIDRIELLDIRGKLMNIKLQVNQIDIGPLETGIYILRVYTTDIVYVGKFIKH